MPMYVFLNTHTYAYGQMKEQRGQMIMQRVGLGIYPTHAAIYL